MEPHREIRWPSSKLKRQDSFALKVGHQGKTFINETAKKEHALSGLHTCLTCAHGCTGSVVHTPWQRRASVICKCVCCGKTFFKTDYKSVLIVEWMKYVTVYWNQLLQHGICAFWSFIRRPEVTVPPTSPAAIHGQKQTNKQNAHTIKTFNFTRIIHCLWISASARTWASHVSSHQQKWGSYLLHVIKQS